MTKFHGDVETTASLFYKCRFVNNNASSLRVIENKIGFDAVRRMVEENCVSLPAAELVEAMSFHCDFCKVRLALERTSEMKEALASDTPFSLNGLSDVRAYLAELRAEGSFIETADLGRLRSSLKVIVGVKNFFRVEDGDAVSYPRLEELTRTMSDPTAIVKAINSVLADNGEIKDNASPELMEIRQKMATIQGRISSAMRKVVARAVSEGVLEADVQPAIRDGRLTLPVTAMNKRRLQGIVHDSSSSGRTFFIEPAEVVELSNEQRELELNERHEIIRILTNVASLIRPMLPQLNHDFNLLWQLDFIRAKALFAIMTDSNMPDLVDKCVIEWHDARHPVLKLNLESKGRSVVPLNIDLTADTARILLISGPNAGGKSVALKTVGINQYMVQCGLLPCMERGSRMGIFDRVFASLGDDQSMDDDLSTYSSHLRDMKHILSTGTDKSLVLIDEFGSGTEPQAGGAIAQALLAEFNEKGMWGVITTHYQNLKQFAQETPGIVNGSMVYDRQLMKPTFRMVMGNPGSSFAIEIATRTGLPKSIIDKARNFAGSDYFNIDKYLMDINRDRRYWENKRADIKRREKHLEEVIARYEQNAETLRQQRRTIISEAKTEADSIIARSNAAVERTIHEIRRSQADKDQTRQLREQLAEERLSIARQEVKESEQLKKAPRPKSKKKTPQVLKGASEEPLAVGHNVLLDNQGQPGTIIEISRDKATVSFGALKMSVPLTRLNRTIRKATSKPGDDTSILSRQTVESSRQRQLSFNTEIDVRGMRADEAIQAVTYFIDDALQFNASRVRILHGTGTGALRQAIRRYLSALPAVKAFEDEDVRFGGAGITVVDL